MIRGIDSKDMVGDQRAHVLEALAKCKHHKRFNYRTLIVCAIGVHKKWPFAEFWDHQADTVDLLRFVYRHQLQWPIGLYEPPTSRVTGRLMGLAIQIKQADGSLVGAQDRHGEPVWVRWDGRIPSPFSAECCV